MLTRCGPGAVQQEPPLSSASNTPEPPQTPVSGRTNSTRLAAAWSPVRSAVMERICSYPVRARKVGALP